MKIKTSPAERQVRICKSILEIDDLEDDDSESKSATEDGPAAQPTIYSQINRNLLSQEFVDRGIQNKATEQPNEKGDDSKENDSQNINAENQ